MVLLSVLHPELPVLHCGCEWAIVIRSAGIARNYPCRCASQKANRGAVGTDFLQVIDSLPPLASSAPEYAGPVLSKPRFN